MSRRRRAAMRPGSAGRHSRGREAEMPFTNLLVAVDGSEASNRALSKALELAALTGASVTALAVEGPLPAYAATVGEVDEVKREKDAFFGGLARDVREQGERAGVPIDVDVRPGHAAELISRVAKERGADLIVLGHRGHFLRDHLLGSTADRVAEHAEGPGLVVKGASLLSLFSCPRCGPDAPGSPPWALPPS